MSARIIIRPALPEDAPVIIDFQLKMALESEHLNLDPQMLEPGVEAVFADPSKGKYYVAECENKVIASLMTTFEWSDWRNRQIIWLQSVYVMPEHRKMGVFRKMYEYIQRLVNQSDEYGGIRLYVDQGNNKAISVYQSVGMNGAHYTTFEWMKDNPAI